MDIIKYLPGLEYLRILTKGFITLPRNYYWLYLRQNHSFENYRELDIDHLFVYQPKISFMKYHDLNIDPDQYFEEIFIRQYGLITEYSEEMKKFKSRYPHQFLPYKKYALNQEPMPPFDSIRCCQIDQGNYAESLIRRLTSMTTNFWEIPVVTDMPIDEMITWNNGPFDVSYKPYSVESVVWRVILSGRDSIVTTLNTLGSGFMMEALYFPDQIPQEVIVKFNNISKTFYPKSDYIPLGLAHQSKFFSALSDLITEPEVETCMILILGVENILYCDYEGYTKELKWLSRINYSQYDPYYNETSSVDFLTSMMP